MNVILQTFSTERQISALESQLRKLEESKNSDIDAFLPADKKKPQKNPLRHCMAGFDEVNSGSRAGQRGGSG